MNKFFNGPRASSQTLFALVFFVFKLSASPQNVWLECPSNVTISCDQSISDLDKWGKLWIWEDYVKKPGPAPTKIFYDLNSCGIGDIIRTWEYEDKHWILHTCSQTITVINSGRAFSYTDITWPLNLELEGCNPNADPKSLSKPYNYPVFTKLSCSQPMYSFQDSKFTVADGCMKILRTWKVIDWCQYIPNSYNPIGIWTYTQVIKLIAKDSTAKLICPVDTTINSYADCKGIFVNLDSVYGFSKCGAITKISNNSPYSTYKGANASGYYPIGTTKFYFFGEYACGKQITCQLSITVQGKAGPTPYCLPGIIVTLMPVDANKDGIPEDGMIEVWAKDVDHGSYSKCGYKNLNYSFTSDIKNKSRIFTCADLGKNNVEMWVTDSLGNQAYCKTYIEIQNNNNRIPDCKRDSVKGGGTQVLTISGLLVSPSNKPTNGIMMNLSKLNSYVITEKRDTIIKISYDTIKKPSGLILYIQKSDTQVVIHRDSIKAIITNHKMNELSGEYAFQNLSIEKDYMLQPECDQNNLKGIDSEDAIILLRHVLGIDKIITPYKKLAADINADGLITRADFDLLNGVLNGTKKMADIPKLWRFVPNLYDISSLPKLNSEYMSYSALKSSISNANFTVVKVGDINNSYNGLIDENLTSRSMYKTVASSSISSFEAESSYNLVLNFNRNINSLFLNDNPDIKLINFDRDWIQIDQSNLYTLNSDKENNQLKLKLYFNRKMTIDDHAIQHLFNDAKLEYVSIISDETNKNSFTLLNAYPNPVLNDRKLNLDLKLSEDTELNIEFFDLQGRTLYRESKNMSNGFHTWEITLNDNLTAGVYYYRIKDKSKSQQGKINISR